MENVYEGEDTIKGIAWKLMEHADTMNIVFEVHEKDEKLYYQVVFVNEAFSSQVGVSKERLYAVYLTQEALLQKVAFAVDWVNLDDIYNTKISAQGTMYIAKYDMYLKINAFLLDDKYICMEFVDVSDYEISKKNNENLIREVSVAREKEKYHNDLQADTSNKLEISKRIYKHISETSSDGFIYKNWQNNETRVSYKLKDLFEMSDEDMKSYESVVDYFQTIIDPVDVELYLAIRTNAINNTEPYFEKDTYVEGLRKWVRMRVHFFYNTEGSLVEEISYYKEITDLVEHKQKLEYWAYYDSLTGLYNRNYFYNLVDEFIEKAEAQKRSLYIMYVDMDDFKKINDSLGFKCGDELITKISDYFKQYVSERVRIARFNSDEFVFSIFGSRYEVEQIYDNIKKHFSKAIHLSDGIQIYITFSVGVVEYPDDGRSSNELIGNADIAMYSVKEKGKNGVCYFKANMLNNFLQNVRLESLLKKAIKEQEFELYYQPQYDIKTNKLRGVEALIRWNEKTQGFISPGKFIPLAEKNGSIIEIGNWVLRQAFSDYKNRFEQCNYRGILSINISTVQFKDPLFEENIVALIKEFAIEPEKIELEITESIFIGEGKDVLELIKRLRDTGVKISLDDFGTGYSSLSYLKNISIDTLKLDKSFIDSVINEDATSIITSSIVSMVKQLGLETIAEGVETREQVEYLKAIECNSIQGFLLGKPMNVDDICMILEADNC